MRIQIVKTSEGEKDADTNDEHQKSLGGVQEEVSFDKKETENRIM